MITRLGLYGGPRSPYGSFAGKESVTDEEIAQSGSIGRFIFYRIFGRVN